MPLCPNCGKEVVSHNLCSECEKKIKGDVKTFSSGKRRAGLSDSQSEPTISSYQPGNDRDDKKRELRSEKMDVPNSPIYRPKEVFISPDAKAGDIFQNDLHIDKLFVIDLGSILGKSSPVSNQSHQREITTNLVHLVYSRDDGKSGYIGVSEESIVIGRLNTPDARRLKIDEYEVVAFSSDRIERLGISDGMISRRKPGLDGHARFFIEGGGLFVEPLKGKNHTYHNGECLQTEVPRRLHAGEYVRLGRYTQFRVETDPDRTVTVQKDSMLLLPQSEAREIGIHTEDKFVPVSTIGMKAGTYELESGKRLVIPEANNDRSGNQIERFCDSYLTEIGRFTSSGQVSMDQISRSLLPLIEGLVHSMSSPSDLERKVDSLQRESNGGDYSGRFLPQLKEVVDDLQQRFSNARCR